MAISLKHQNKVQFLVRLRRRYREEQGLEACRLAARMLELLDGGDVTQAQMLNAWNMTAQEWSDKRANKLQPRANKWEAHKAATNAAEVEGQD